MFDPLATDLVSVFIRLSVEIVEEISSFIICFRGYKLNCSGKICFDKQCDIHCLLIKLRNSRLVLLVHSAFFSAPEISDQTIVKFLGFYLVLIVCFQSLRKSTFFHIIR